MGNVGDRKKDKKELFGANSQVNVTNCRLNNTTEVGTAGSRVHATRSALFFSFFEIPSIFYSLLRLRLFLLPIRK